jgi:N-acetylneuraminic acid mutarotase
LVAVLPLLTAWRCDDPLDPTSVIALHIAGPSPASAVAGQPYTGVVACNGGVAPYAWDVASLPGWLGAVVAGDVVTLSGTPPTAGDVALAIAETDAHGMAAASPLTLPIYDPLVPDAVAPAPHYVDDDQSIALSASGGLPPYTWSLASGTLPPGFAIGAASLDGSAPLAGSYAYQLAVRDSADPPQTVATASITHVVDRRWSPAAPTLLTSGRFQHSTVSTGGAMIVWGGLDPLPTATGAIYDPASDTWTDITSLNAPSARCRHSAVWTGSKMIVWGGDASADGTLPVSTGGVYTPGTDSWTATSITSVPLARFDHTAVWTGTQMIVWGGQSSTLVRNTGSRYTLATNTWASTIGTGAPTARTAHSAVWTGTTMLIWGGWNRADHPTTTTAGTSVKTGGEYTPATNAWVAIPDADAPQQRMLHTAAWTGSLMIVWGGATTANAGGEISFANLNDGLAYDPATQQWLAMTATCPIGPRRNHRAVWTGSEMLVWGGYGGGSKYWGDGAAYEPTARVWTPLNNDGAPLGRHDHSTAWTGTELVIWGGRSPVLGVASDGAVYVR